MASFVPARGVLFMWRVLTIAAGCIALTTTLASCSTAGGTAAATSSAAPEQSSGTVRAPFRATGNEPSWRLDIGNTEMALLTNFGQDRLVAVTPKAQVSGATTRYVARTDQGELTATIVEQLCVDSMSGMPHPQSVTVVVGGKTLTGCGGQPASLLQSAEWTVVEIAGAALVAGSKVTLAFAPDGHLSGHASCNRFMSTYTLSGEGLAIAAAAGTRMMCEATLMEQERTFLAALSSVQNFSIAVEGALLLRTGDGRTIKAQRR
jgi:heat shock protein HslJ